MWITLLVKTVSLEGNMRVFMMLGGHTKARPCFLSFLSSCANLIRLRLNLPEMD